MKPITLNYEWNKKFASVGWQPKNFQSIGSGILGDIAGESIMGLIKTGDNVGELLEARVRVIKGENSRKVETIVGFTTGEWNNDLPKDNLIPPTRRIQGYLVITSKRFVIQGYSKYEIKFDDLIASHSGGNAQSNSNGCIKELGVSYRFGGDVSTGVFEVRNQNNFAPDRFYVALLYNERNVFSFINGINNDVANVWDNLLSFLHSSLF